MSTQQRVVIEEPCDHVPAVKIHAVHRPASVCEDCVKIGSEWVHLRICLTCGHVACCDSSPNRHATKHFHTVGHPIATSGEAGETWTWCFADERAIGS